MMQEYLLRVFLVAMGLFMYPKEDPMVEDDITMTMQDHRERLMREGEELDQEIAPVNQEMTHITSNGPWGDAKSLSVEQNQPTVSNEVKHAEKAEDVALTNKNVLEDVYPKLDPNITSKSSFEPDTNLESSQIDHEYQLNVLQMKAQSQLDKDSVSISRGERKDTQTGSVGDSSSSQRQKEKPGEVLSLQEVSLSRLTETSDTAITDWEQDYLWYIFNTFSIISMIRFFMKFSKKYSKTEHGHDKYDASASPENYITSEVPIPDSDTLQRFYSKCIQASPNKWREDEFLEGLVSDLFSSMRTICDRNDSMVIEGFQMVTVCNIIVPFSPPEPYKFCCLIQNNQASDLLPDMNMCGQIKLVEKVKIQNTCNCQTSGVNIVCLLHCDTKTMQPKETDAFDGLLCMKNTPFLSKSQVTKWFQSTIKQAWTLISHKYGFELNICRSGAIAARFRSGKIIRFSMNPVVKFSTGAHFFCTPNILDICWSLSTTIYEDQVIEQVSKHLPGNSCHIQALDIAHFLHRTQKALSGRSALKDSHFKTALIHLLLTKEPPQWQPKYLACRLQDLLVFLERSLHQKLILHFLIGNPFKLNEIDLPASFCQAKPVNLFHPLVVDKFTYTNAVRHFQEMLRNTDLLIRDYVSDN
ncbi:inositol 1,4,5-trisphosphate receptor-interacting protein [Genypterus blacodes]|uniref:inositol 1,4,5-trisphosphate receptor-interacting protein n=1 Tax=Genypterus blacodes TaxID=154954 RepID=UPI003F760764